MKRWVLPVELSKETLTDLQHKKPADVETELFAFGRLPLAISARCFTAHSLDLPKDNCQLKCLDYPDGILMQTQENEPFLNINGVQLQSAHCYNLLPEINSFKQLGIDILRISPQENETDKIIQIFHDCISDKMDMTDAQSMLHEHITDLPCDGYWHGSRGIEYLHSQQGLNL
jgi:collagenase-like PrtC family protease